MDRPLDASWDDPLPHALTKTRTYLSFPSSKCDVAVIAIHGRGDNANDFVESFLPHLREFFHGSRSAQGQIESDEEDASNGSGVRITVRALEALDGIWFPSHKPNNEIELAFGGPYVYSSLLKISDEIASLQSKGIASSKIILVGFSQGAILVNSYLIQALKTHAGEDAGNRLPLPARVLGWAGSCFSFQTTFPRKAWPYFDESQDLSLSLADLNDQTKSDVRGIIEAHQQCGASDRYFTQDEIEHTAAKIAHTSRQAKFTDEVRVSVTMEPGAHSVLPGMVAKLIQMIQDVHHMHQ